MGVSLHQGGDVKILVVACLTHVEGLDVPVLGFGGKLGAGEDFEDFDEHADFDGVFLGDVHAAKELFVKEVFFVFGEFGLEGLEMFDAAIEV